MKINKKKLALANIIAGYALVIAFIALVVANRADTEEAEVVVNDPDGLFVEKTEEGIKIALYGNDRMG